MTVLMALLGSLGFAILFNVRGKNLIAATAGGTATWALYLLLASRISEAFLCYALSAMFAGLFSLVMARIRKAPSTEFLVPALVPLIPGGSLYYTMLAAVTGDWPACFAKGIDTLVIAAAIAIGQAVAPSLDALMRSALLRRRKRHDQHHADLSGAGRKVPDAAPGEEGKRPEP